MAAGSTAYPGGMTVRVSYAGEVTLEEAVPGGEAERDGGDRPGQGKRVTAPAIAAKLDTFAARRTDGLRAGRR